MSRPTLFLDFDGVLHPERASSSQYFLLAPKLADCLSVHPHVDIVISSTWRSRYTVPELKNLLPSGLSERVLGTTSEEVDTRNLPDRLLGYPRHAQCWQWQLDHKDASDTWLALDDKPWLFYPLTPQLIECDGSIGLTDKTVEALDKALRGLRAI